MPGAYYVDVIWQAAVRFEFYEDYCDFIAGGYIERFDKIDKEIHKSYWTLYSKYIEKN